MLEHFFNCPYCGETISVLIDPSIYSQEYIEDCEVCCNPINIRYTTEENEVVGFVADSIEQ